MGNGKSAGLLVVSAIALVIAACGSSGVDPTSDDPTFDAGETNPAEYVERLARCIRTGGGEVDLKNPVTFSAQPGPGMSDETMQRLMNDCRAQAGPPPERQLDAATARDTYARWVEVHECLVDLGYRPDDPPSEEVFVEEFVSTGFGWHPYDGLDGQFRSFGEQLEVEEKCPPWVD